MINDGMTLNEPDRVAKTCKGCVHYRTRLNRERKFEGYCHLTKTTITGSQYACCMYAEYVPIEVR